jgi:hypothetical protein
LTLTLRRLNRATLARQGLLQRRPMTVVDAVRGAVALQAQEAPSPYLALWNRVEAFDADDLDRAFATQAVVKTQLFRITLHAVAADDYPAFHEAMEPTLRAARLHDGRFRSEGVSVDDARALIPDLVEFNAEPRSNADVEAWLEARFGEPKPRVWWALRQYGPFVHAQTGGAWSFGVRPAFLRAAEQARPGDVEASTRQVVRRYLQGFGPASMSDIAQFSTIYKPPIKTALEELRDELTLLDGPEGERLYDVADGVLPDEDVAAPPRLLPMWESTLLAYAGRARIVPPVYRRMVMRENGDVLPSLLVDGFVGGVWRVVDAGIEATAFERLDDATWARIEAEARALLRFLDGRDTAIYRRYGHWWNGLAGAEVRVLR